MSKYFTKEYIKECRNEKIQGLKTELQVGDWFYSGKTHCVDSYHSRAAQKDLLNYFYWLPTGDPLDEEIVKICKGTNGYYEFSYTDRTTPNKYFKSYTAMVGIPSKHISIEVKDDNPLIAKIKLLKQLLK